MKEQTNQEQAVIRALAVTTGGAIHQVLLPFHVFMETVARLQKDKRTTLPVQLTANGKSYVENFLIEGLYLPGKDSRATVQVKLYNEDDMELLRLPSHEHTC